ncbi:MAG TPA: MFS transporter, partial [Alphaproteobacteria bacterium]|nr:MFS transporter [Alphaproteobacteria bacterium]
ASQQHLGRRLTRPFKDRNFRRLLVFLGSWNFAVNLAAPFFTVHMLKALGLDITTVVMLTTLSSLANILVLRQWGAIADRFSNKSVLRVCAPLFLLCIFAWTFTTFPERHAGTIPLLVAIHIFAGIATAGVTLSSSTIALKLAPAGDATAYLATNSLVNAVCAGAAPIIGGYFADFFAASELTLTLHWSSPGELIEVSTLSLRHWDFFFLMAAALGLYSVHRLGLVQERGEVGERVVVANFVLWFRRSMRNISSVAGLRAVSEFPFDLLLRRRRRRARDEAAGGDLGPAD